MSIPVLLGIIYGAGSISELTSPVALAFAVYFLIPGNLFFYGLNDAFDTDTDKYNPKKSEEGKEQSFRDTTFVKVAIGISGLLAVPLFAVTAAPAAVLALAGWAFLTVTYSAPPLRLKSIPLVDSFVNGLYVLPGVAVYMTIAGSFPPVSGIAGFWIWTMGYHTFGAILDIDPDRKAGVRTPSVFG